MILFEFSTVSLQKFSGSLGIVYHILDIFCEVALKSKVKKENQNLVKKWLTFLSGYGILKKHHSEALAKE